MSESIDAENLPVTASLKLADDEFEALNQM